MDDIENSAPALDDQAVSLPSPVQSTSPESPEKVKGALDASKPVRKALDKAKVVQKDEMRARGETEARPENPYAENRLRASIKRGIDGARAKGDAQDAVRNEFGEAPSRFSPDAKEEWATTPKSVRAEITRTTREMEKGFEKHRAGAQSWEGVRQFDEIARRNGGSLQASLAKVVEIEQAFARDPVDGLHRICSHLGIDMHQLASKVAQMQPEQIHAMRSNSQVQNLNGRLQQAEAHLHHMQYQQVRTAISYNVDAFAKAHPRFEELADQIAKEIGAGHDLEEAYSRAERSAGPSREKQLNAGRKSVSGAPTYGASEGGKPRSSSIRDSLRKAMGGV
ncbi:MAG: hypothetical protein ABS57_06605 [Mesorhizobium sp. SCN 65-12]|nr:MAG: hypothetical protein ABS57_06605 [Mesorhizobium sp. SCN 65-12]